MCFRKGSFLGLKLRGANCFMDAVTWVASMRSAEVAIVSGPAGNRLVHWQHVARLHSYIAAVEHWSLTVSLATWTVEGGHIGPVLGDPEQEVCLRGLGPQM